MSASAGSERPRSDAGLRGDMRTGTSRPAVAWRSERLRRTPGPDEGFLELRVRHGGALRSRTERGQR
jgi:hypothetical protein